MEKYFKATINKKIIYSTLLVIIFLSLSLSSCNKASVVEGFENNKSTIIALNTDLISNTTTPTNVNLNLNGNIVAVPFSFYIAPASASTSNYRFFSNAPTNFRWGMETYIKRFNIGDLITENTFVPGGTQYFISALKTGSNYSYTYSYSFKTNELSYAAFRYEKTIGSMLTVVYGWISFTATDTKVTLHKYGYKTDEAINAGQ